MISPGNYPDVPLKLARDRRDAARRQGTEKVDLSALRLAGKLERHNNFRQVAEQWLEHPRQTLHAETIARILIRLKDWVYDAIGYRPMTEIWAADLSVLLRRVEAGGCQETAHRTRPYPRGLLCYAVATGRAEHDGTVELRGPLAPVKSAHFAARVDPKELGALLRAIDSYQGQTVTGLALKWLPHVFVRPWRGAWGLRRPRCVAAFCIAQVPGHLIRSLAVAALSPLRARLLTLRHGLELISQLNA